jgi:acetyl esterase
MALMNECMLTIAIIMAIQVFIGVLLTAMGDADLGSFTVAKVSFLFMPKTFPNDLADVERWRKLLAASAVSLQPPVDISSEDVYIAGSAGEEEARFVRIYNANSMHSMLNNNASAPRDVLVFAYPGAWMMGSVNDLDFQCKTVANHTNFVVVSVDYRLAPEHPFPAAFNDVMAALRWVKHNIHDYGGNADRIFLGGESAGGNLAAAVALRNLDTAHVPEEERVSVVGLLLVYPALAANFSTPSYTQFGQYNGLLTIVEMKHAWAMYAAGQDIPQDEYAYQPSVASDLLLSAFPRTELITANFDVLRDDSYDFAARLTRLGVQARVTNYPSTIHGFWGRDVTPVGQEALIATGKKLLEMAADVSMGAVDGL